MENTNNHAGDAAFISIIVPFHNMEAYVADCAEALLNQSYPKSAYEIIMVDNNSTDSSARIVERYPTIKLVSETRRGAYAARNTALRMARGEVIAFTDVDCIPDKDWLETIADVMNGSSCPVLLGSYVPVAGDFGTVVLTEYENAKNEYIFSSKNPDVYYGYTNNMAVRSSLFSEFGLFAEKLRGSDALFVQQVVLAKGCDAVRYVPAMRVQHLEFSSVMNYYRKLMVHSSSVRRLEYTSGFRALRGRERLSILRRMIRKQGYGPFASLRAILLLVVGLILWTWARVRVPRSKATMPSTQQEAHGSAGASERSL